MYYNAYEVNIHSLSLLNYLAEVPPGREAYLWTRCEVNGAHSISYCNSNDPIHSVCVTKAD